MIPTIILRKAMHDIAAKKGEFTFFAMLRRTDSPGTWDLVVSAPWLEAGKLKAVSELVKMLSDSIGEGSLREFSRIATVSGDEPAVRFILDNLPVDDGEFRAQSTELLALDIEDGIIFRAMAPTKASKRLPSKALHPTVGGSSRGRG